MCKIVRLERSGVINGVLHLPLQLFPIPIFGFLETDGRKAHLTFVLWESWFKKMKILVSHEKEFVDCLTVDLVLLSLSGVNSIMTQLLAHPRCNNL